MLFGRVVGDLGGFAGAHPMLEEAVHVETALGCFVARRVRAEPKAAHPLDRFERRRGRRYLAELECSNRALDSLRLRPRRDTGLRAYRVQQRRHGWDTHTLLAVEVEVRAVSA